MEVVRVVVVKLMFAVVLGLWWWNAARS